MRDVVVRRRENEAPIRAEDGIWQIGACSYRGYFGTARYVPQLRGALN